jgi:L-ornithine N5-oxygenase
MRLVSETVYDVIGVGFGVSNIGLAIALEESGRAINSIFIEAGREAAWQPEMLLPGSDIQNSPHRDRITPVNPRSNYTFINYLHIKGRLFEYFNLGRIHPFRSEYADYIKWCAKHFSSSVLYSARATSINVLHREREQLFVVSTDSGAKFLARHVVLGTGRERYIPSQFEPHLGRRVFHSDAFISSIHKAGVDGANRIAVVGSSQSAIEIVLDLRARLPDAQIYNFSRGFAYRLKDTSNFSYESFYPGFIDFYYELGVESKQDVVSRLRSVNYGVADEDVINQLYGAMYEDRITGNERVNILMNKDIVDVSSMGAQIEISFSDKYSGELDRAGFDYVVLATGFIDYPLADSDASCIPLLSGVIEQRRTLGPGVNRDYSVKGVAGSSQECGRIYLNGLCEMSHGFGDAGSISSVSIRCDSIAKSIISRA